MDTANLEVSSTIKDFHQKFYESFRALTESPCIEQLEKLKTLLYSLDLCVTREPDVFAPVVTQNGKAVLLKDFVKDNTQWILSKLIEVGAQPLWQEVAHKTVHTQVAILRLLGLRSQSMLEDVLRKYLELTRDLNEEADHFWENEDGGAVSIRNIAKKKDEEYENLIVTDLESCNSLRNACNQILLCFVPSLLTSVTDLAEEIWSVAESQISESNLNLLSSALKLIAAILTETDVFSFVKEKSICLLSALAKLFSSQDERIGMEETCNLHSYDWTEVFGITLKILNRVAELTTEDRDDWRLLDISIVILRYACEVNWPQFPLEKVVQKFKSCSPFVQWLYANDEAVLTELLDSCYVYKESLLLLEIMAEAEKTNGLNQSSGAYNDEPPLKRHKSEETSGSKVISFVLNSFKHLNSQLDSKFSEQKFIIFTRMFQCLCFCSLKLGLSLDFPHLVAAATQQLLQALKGFDGNESLQKLVSCAMDILSCSSLVAVLEPLPSEVGNQIVGLMTLPWMVYEVSFADLTLPNKKAFEDVARRIDPFLDIKMKNEFFLQLSRSPIDLCSQWRAKCLKYAFQELQDQNLVEIAGQLHWILHNHLAHGSELVLNSLKHCIESKNLDVKLRVCQIAPVTVCTLTRNSILVWSGGNILDPLLTIRCSICCPPEPSAILRSSKSNKQLISKDFMKAYIGLLKSDQPSVAKCSTTLIQRIAKHLQKEEAYDPEFIHEVLSLFKDGDEEVATMLAEILDCLVSPKLYKAKGQEVGGALVVETVEAMLEKALADKDSTKLRILLAAVLSLSHSPSQEVQLQCCHLLLRVMLICEDPISSTAQQTLKNCFKQSFVRESYKELFSTVAEAVSSEGPDVLKGIEFLISILDGKGREDNEETIRTELVPLLVVRASKGNHGALKVLNSLPNLLRPGMTLAQLLRDGFPNIWIHAILKCSRSDAELVENFLKSRDFDINQMRASTKQALTYYLLFHNVLAPGRALDELASLASLDSYGNVIHPPVTVSQKNIIAETLQTRFLGALVHLNQRLSQPMPQSQKLIIFQSFPGIFKILGQRIVTLFYFKILSTLRLALKNMEQLYVEVVDAWDSFVRYLLPSALPNVMLKVAASLWPYRDVARQSIHKIFRYMVIDSTSCTSDDIYKLCILEGIEEFPDIASKVNAKAKQKEGLKEELKMLLSIIEHDDETVSVLGLTRLRGFLKEQVSHLHDMVLSADSGDFLVSQLVITLCARYHDAGSQAKVLFGECLGLIGAIEPSRLVFSVDTEKQASSTLYQDVSSEDFALDLFSRICSAFLQSSSTQITTFSYTIQELLKAYNIDPDMKNSNGLRLWSKMSEHQQMVFRPFLSTLYQLVGKSGPPMPRILFGSKFPVHAHSSWICVWTEEMVSRVNMELPRKIFTATVPAFKKSTAIQVFLLPYVVTQLILEGDVSVVDQLHDEISAVISHPESTPASIHTVFLITDHLNAFLSAKEASVTPKKNTTTQELLKHDKSYHKIKDFLKRIPDEKVSEAAARAGAYARAVKHLELDVMKHPDEKEKKAGFLQELYVCLDEPDGVIGAASLVPRSSVDITVKTYEATGDYQSAIAALRAKLCSSTGHETSEIKRRIARCYLELNQPDAVLEFVKGCTVDGDKDLKEYQAEASWRLGNWSGIEEKEIGKNQLTWGDGIGAALLVGKDCKMDPVSSVLSQLRSRVLDHMAVVTLEKGWYLRAYPDIARLAVMRDLEITFEFLSEMVNNGTFNSNAFSNLIQSWNKRREIAQSSIRVLEPMMTVQRVALKLIAEKAESLRIEIPPLLEVELAKNLSFCVRLARKAGQTQRALSYILESECSIQNQPPSTMLEKAKWQWLCGMQGDAIKDLQTGIAHHFPNITQLKQGAPEMKHLAAESKLLLAKYLDLTDTLDYAGLLARYKDAVTINSASEEILFEMALFYDRAYQSQDEKDKNVLFLHYTCSFLTKSLEHGSSFIYRSLPRFLTIWLDLGAKVCEMPESNARLNSKKVLAQLNENANTIAKRLPSYKLLTAFSQMLSRICHPHPEVWGALKVLIARTLRDYPQQAVWQMMVMMKSTQKARSQRCAEITQLACENNPELKKFIQDAVSLTEKLIDVAERKVEESSFSIKHHFRDLYKMFQTSSFSKIIIPIQMNMTETLPMAPGAHKDFEPFPNRLVYITGIVDEVEILPSLQKPKKFIFLCDDGKKYAMMAKPKDDLRKDARVMEFNKVVNRLLRADTETRRRDLYIRTYAVVALNEETGLVEWVPNLNGLRPILYKLYSNRRISMQMSDLKKYMPGAKDPIERKLELYRALCARVPPILGDWFLNVFQDAKTWLMARHNYVRTTAVISMVGFILGLGDRHGENILIDSVSGDTCHVDYNCLFNKGETFEVPERVPFRLTKNMVHAMGLTGVEGVFRRCCEATMRVMRNESDTLLTVLRPLVHDPLVEWSKAKKASTNDDKEFKSEKAMEVVRNIELRLQGAMVSRTRARASTQKLSIEGQVNQLILEASSDENLAQMYFGWAPHL